MGDEKAISPPVIHPMLLTITNGIRNNKELEDI